jgi:hypothetical protein
MYRDLSEWDNVQKLMEHRAMQQKFKLPCCSSGSLAREASAPALANPRVSETAAMLKIPLAGGDGFHP